MVDVTSELQQMADDAARRARPLAAADVIRRGDRRHRRSVTRLSVGGLSAAGVVAAVIIGVIALAPASRQASHRAHAELAAWSFVHFKNNPCQEYSGGESQAQNVLTGQDPLQVGFTVHPSAIPRGAGVQIVANSNVGYYPQPVGPMALFEWLVQASPQC